MHRRAYYAILFKYISGKKFFLAKDVFEKMHRQDMITQKKFFLSDHILPMNHWVFGICVQFTLTVLFRSCVLQSCICWRCITKNYKDDRTKIVCFQCATKEARSWQDTVVFKEERDCSYLACKYSKSPKKKKGSWLRTVTLNFYGKLLFWWKCSNALQRFQFIAVEIIHFLFETWTNAVSRRIFAFAKLHRQF